MADTTSASIVVAASRDQVLAVIADFAAYPLWAVGIRSAVVEDREVNARPRVVRFALDAGPIRDSYALAYNWDGMDGVRWSLAEPGSTISQLSGSYRLEEQPTGTRVTYELSVGLRVPMPGFMRRVAERKIIESALSGLKGRAEGLAVGSKGRTA